MLSAYTIHLDKAFASTKLLVQIDDNKNERVHILDEEFTNTKKAMAAAQDFISELEEKEESDQIGLFTG